MRLPFFRRRVEPAPVLAMYTGPAFWQRHRKKLLFLLVLWTLFYGLAFGLTTTYFLLQLTIPLILLAAAMIWLLPETETAPVGLLHTLLFAFVIVLLLWPDYLAITLSGLPWITAIRLAAVPLAFVLFVCLSTSREMREELSEVLSTAPWVWKLLTAFGVVAIFSVFTSSETTASVNKLIVAGTNWFLVFFVAAYVFRTPGRVTRFAYLLCGIAVVVSLIGVQEYRHSAVPWAGHIPSFLAVQDESVQRILAGAARAATGIYRVQSKFTTSLGLAEFYALLMPFLVHFMVYGQRWWLRVGAAVMIPLVFRMIILTDSRLGMVGFFLSCVLYLAIWAIWRWQRDRDSLFGPATILAFPAVFVAFLVSTFAVGRLRALVWGSGAQQASTDGRKQQFIAGIPKVLEQPWGYGIGRSAETLGFTNAAGSLTIDTYYLAVALEYGVIGFVIYYAMFINALWNGARRIPRAYATEHMLIAPLTIALFNFVVIKSIFSQQENHPLAFIMLGALIALCWQMDRSEAGEQAAGDAPR